MFDIKSVLSKSCQNIRWPVVRLQGKLKLTEKEENIGVFVGQYYILQYL